MHGHPSWFSDFEQEISAASERAQRAAQARREPGTPEYDAWVAAYRELCAIQMGNAGTIRAIREGITHHDPTAVDRALDYLEEDPYYFWSGYVRKRVAHTLGAHGIFDAHQAERARTIVIAAIDGRLHPGNPGVARIARAVANNALRREVRSRLHHRDPSVAYRALLVVVEIRHPGYTPEDLARAREIVLHEMSKWAYAPTLSQRAAFRLWSSTWEVELRDIAAVHGPDRAAVKNLLRHVDYRRAGKERRRAGP
jgi:hypothetical protein